MSIRTPFAKVEGLGAARSGTEHFWRERATSVALIPLTLWFVYAALQIVGLPYEAALAFLQQPCNAIALLLFVLTTVYHMTLGIQVVIEDYVPHEGQKVALLLLNKGFGWVVGVASVFALLRIAL